MPQIKYKRPWLADYQRDALFTDKRYGIVEGSTKCGKAQPLDALVYTPGGPIRMGDVAVGTNVCTPDGVSAVVAIHPQGVREIWKVTFSDGAVVEVDADHLWEVHQFGAKPVIITTAQLRVWPEDRRHRSWVPRIKPVVFDHCAVPLDPYLVGALIGDGNLAGHSIRIASADEEILTAIAHAMPEGYSLIHENNHDWRLTTTLSEAASQRESGTHIKKILRDLGLTVLSHMKMIPSIYRYNTEAVRWSILQGIFDTDGFVNYRGQPSIEQTSETLAKHITEVVQSLGGSVLTNFRKSNGYRNSDGQFVVCKPVWRQVIRHPDAQLFFRLSRKRARCTPKKKTGNRMFRSIELSRHDYTQCIQIADDRHLYLTNGCIPTHNTAPCLIWLAEQAMAGTAGRNYWWVAPVYTQAEIAFRRMKRGFPPGMLKANDSDRHVTLPNKTMIWFKSAEKPDNLYGEDVYAAVVDEASRCREDSWIAVRSTLTATRGPVRIIGNVKGRRNWAYALARKAEAGDPAMSYKRITAYDASRAICPNGQPLLSPDEIDQARSDLPESVFRELYLAEPSDDGGNPFGIAAIGKCVGAMSAAQPFVWGWDLAKHVDWTVGIALDVNGAVCRFERWQKTSWEDTTDRIVRETAGAPALIDSTGVGDPILERLQKSSRAFEGYQFTSPSKQKLMEGLSVAIQRSEIVIPDGPIRRELEEFEYESTRTGIRYSAPVGFHDDCVCALALAQMHRSHAKPGFVVSPEMLARMGRPRRVGM